MPGRLHPRTGRGEVSRHLSGQNQVVEKMKADRPGQPLIAIVKATADEIANHGKEFVEILSLSRHFRIMAGRHQHVFVLFDLKHELFLHEAILPHKTESGKPANRRIGNTANARRLRAAISCRPRSEDG